ncbi:carboxypeptidase-like regulatory domain-containing protein [Leptospira sp. 96542]|nr:carboxypeptidase-like regulatory domain-containing protein [Leptospira sp. 96542]
MMRLFTNIYLLVFFGFFQACYFNPFVQGIVNPVEEEEDSSALLLGAAVGLGSPGKVKLTGQVVDSNGTAISGGTLNIVNRTNTSTDLDDRVNLDEGGRFYLILTTGETSFRVEQSGTEIFTFKLLIPIDGVVSVIEKSIPGPNLINLEFYSSGFTPEYFDIVLTTPHDNENLSSWPTNVTIIFSEPLETPSDLQTFLDANVITSPSITLQGSNSTLNSHILSIYNSSSFSIGTNTYRFGSGIKSNTGKSLAPRTITYICESPCNGS